MTASRMDGAGPHPAGPAPSRERHRAMDAEIERRREAMPDPAPGYERYRELGAGDD